MARVTLGFSGATRTLTRDTLTRSDGYGFWRVRVRVWWVLRVLKPLAGCNTLGSLATYTCQSALAPTTTSHTNAWTTQQSVKTQPQSTTIRDDEWQVDD